MFRNWSKRNEEQRFDSINSNKSYDSACQKRIALAEVNNLLEKGEIFKLNKNKMALKIK